MKSGLPPGFKAIEVQHSERVEVIEFDERQVLRGRIGIDRMEPLSKTLHLLLRDEHGSEWRIDATEYTMTMTSPTEAP